MSRIFHTESFLIQFCDSGNTYINLWNLIPCSVIHSSCLRQSENGLKFSDCCSSCRTIYSICLDLWQCRVCSCDHIQLFLQLPDLCPAGPIFQCIARPGRRNTRNFFCCIDIHITAIKISQNLNRSISLISQLLRPPLCHPVWTTYPVSIAVLGQNWLPYIGSGQIIGKNLVYYCGDCIVNIPLRNPFMIKCCGRCNCKIIPFVPVPFRVNPIQCKRHDRQYICPDRTVRQVA